MKPLYSVIIPTYNRAQKLKRAIESVETQTFKDFELIVCDDGSTDETRDIVASFKNKLNLTYLYEENWGGPARPRNNGLKVAQGEWICFLDADDWWYPRKLEISSQYLFESDIIYHDLDIYPRRLIQLTRKSGRPIKNKAFVDLMTRPNAIPHSSVVVRRDLVVEAGGFSEDKELIAVEDYDLWLKIARLTEHFTYIPESLGAVWLDDDNISKVSERQIARLTAVYNKHTPYLSDDDRVQAELFLHYAVGRVYQRLGMFDQAAALFRKTIKIEDRRLKSLSCAMLCLIRCKRFLPAAWIQV